MNESKSPERFLLYKNVRPAAMREMISRTPVAWIAFGALEWHGEQNPLGLDGLKAYEIVKRAAARVGGVVFPPIYWGATHTMGFPFTFKFPPRLIKAQTKVMLEQLYQMGFRVVVMLTGHYPPQQIKMLRRVGQRFHKKHPDAAALGIPEPALATDIGYYGDHAAMWETSVMMHLFPDLVDLSALPDDLCYLDQCRKHGVVGVNPKKNATAEKGKEAVELIVVRLADAAQEALSARDDAVFERIYRQFDQAMKSVYNIRSGMKVLGAPSLREMVRVVFWSFRGNKQKS